ncbi:MAG TPA: alpha/beta hydrolase [Dongiaceae bacterium]|nr:alpha/beta hydrolase [Dongiaceae bacterium]
MRPDCALATAKMMLLGDYRDRLDAIDVPAVILQQSNDPAVPLAAAQYLHEHLKNSILEVLEAGGGQSGMLARLEEAMGRHLGLPSPPAATSYPSADGPVMLH